MSKIEKIVVLSFDDGYIFQYNFFYPVLRKHRFKGVFYISTGLIGVRGFMGWSHLRDLLDHGHEIGSHAISHLKLTELDDKEMKHEILGSFRSLENIGVKSFAYPYGVYNSKVVSIVRKHYSSARGHYDPIFGSCDLGINHTIGEENVHKLKCIPFEIFEGISSEEFERIVCSLLKIKKGLMIFVFHGISRLTFQKVSRMLELWKFRLPKISTHCLYLTRSFFLNQGIRVNMYEYVERFEKLMEIIHDSNIPVMTITKAMNSLTEK